MSYPCHHCDFEGDTITETKRHIKATHRVVRERDENGKLVRRVV